MDFVETAGCWTLMPFCRTLRRTSESIAFQIRHGSSRQVCVERMEVSTATALDKSFQGTLAKHPSSLSLLSTYLSSS